MKPSERLEAHREAIRAIVAAHRGANPRVFGSVARGEDTEASDLDILIDPVGPLTLFDLGAIENELTRLLGVEIDVLTLGFLPDKARAQVLAEAAPI